MYMAESDREDSAPSSQHPAPLMLHLPQSVNTDNFD